MGRKAVPRLRERLRRLCLEESKLLRKLRKDLARRDVHRPLARWLVSTP